MTASNAIVTGIAGVASGAASATAASGALASGAPSAASSPHAAADAEATRRIVQYLDCIRLRSAQGSARRNEITGKPARRRAGQIARALDARRERGRVGRFYCCPDLRDLHSVPPRRSSDLLGGVVAAR